MTVKLEPPKTKIRAYSGNYPMASQYGVLAGRKAWWGEDDKPLGEEFNDQLWEDAGTVNWVKDESGDNYRPTRVPKNPKAEASTDPDLLNTRFSAFGGTLLPMSKMPKPTTTKPITPADVKAAAKTSPAAAAQQKSVAEQQAEYIRSKGGRTAAEADAEFESNLRKDYSEATGFDINTAEGRRKSFQAALQRGGHADARALNMRAGKYAYLDPNSDAGRKARDTAYQKAWGPDGQFDKGIRAGENPLTGQYKATLGGPAWGSKGLYDTFKGAEDEATDYANNAIDAALNPEPTFSWEQPNFDAAADAVRLMGGKPASSETSDTEGNPEYGFFGAPANGPDRPPTFDEYTGLFGFPKGYFNNPSSAPQQAAPNPLQAQSDASLKRVRDLFVTGTSQPQASKDIGPAFDRLDARLKEAADAVRNIGKGTWTPEKGGHKGGVWYSPADSEPEAGGNYGNPPLINTWTPQAGGRFNGVNYSRADSEPQAGGNYGKPLLVPSKTRPIMQPSRAALLGPRAKLPPITPWQGYGDQM